MVFPLTITCEWCNDHAPYNCMNNIYVPYNSSNTVRPLFCMLALAKQGRGLMCGKVTWLRDDHYRLKIATWVRDVSTFTDGLMGKIGAKRQSKPWYDTNTILATAVGFIGLNIQLDLVATIGEGLMGETNIPVQELWLKMGGELVCERGRICGILRYMLPTYTWV